MLKTLTAVLAVVIVALMAAAAASLPPPPAAHAQNTLAAPGGVTAVDGAQSGQVTVSWQAADGAAFYRIGWVTFDDIIAVRNAGRPWLDAFAFTDVTNYGQTAHPLDGLLPGVQYAFIVGSVNSRFGIAEWSDWVYLTTAAAAAQCPAGAGNPPEPQTPDATPTPTPDPDATRTPTPQPDAAVTPTPTPVAVGTDYDRDDNGLIEITSLAQLDAIRHDLDGDGTVRHAAAYDAAFPNAAAGMGCFRRQCQGYELVANLDFDTNGNGQIDEGDDWWDEGDGWYPIGEPETALRYNAVLEGNGHTIANLYIVWTDTTHIGLFRATGEDAVIRNLGLTSVYVSGGADRVGALAGESGGAVINSYATGEVSGGGRVGGLVGYSAGSIAGSRSSASVSSTGDLVGGLVGSTDGAITDSYSTGNVTGDGYYVGGLVGLNAANITHSYATGNVNAKYNVGGLIGRSSSTSTVTASYATGNVTGNAGNVGGLIGSAPVHIGISSTISASYATGNVSAETGIAGGLVGYGGRIDNSYATGAVTGNGSHGGLTGRQSHSTGYYTITNSYAIGNTNGYGLAGGGSVTASYWDTQTSGTTRSGSGVGKTTREMQRPTGPTGIYADWDPEYWDFGTSRQYPVLRYDGMDVGAQRR